jgi:hypothetical protein
MVTGLRLDGTLMYASFSALRHAIYLTNPIPLRSPQTQDLRNVSCYGILLADGDLQGGEVQNPFRQSWAKLRLANTAQCPQGNPGWIVW